MARKKLSLAHRRLAVAIAKDHFPASGGNVVEFERLVKEDRRTKAIDPALLVLFVQIMMAVFTYFQNRQKTGLPVMSQTDDEIFLGSIRYGA
jgi:hypothetical protein